MAQSRPPVVCAFQNVTFVLPSNLLEQAALLTCNTQQNVRVYSAPDYGHGTRKFQEAEKKAGMAGCR